MVEYRGVLSLTLAQQRSKVCTFGHRLPDDPGELVSKSRARYCPECFRPTCRKREPNAATCLHSHDLTVENAVTPDGKCRVCKNEREREHKRRMRSGVKPVVLRVSSKKAGPNKARPPAYFMHAEGMPPVEVRMGAACGPETAQLFDKRVDGEDVVQRYKRHAMARVICESCPVRDLCTSWYLNEPPTTAVLAAL